jgi:hypothetical protein
VFFVTYALPGFFVWINRFFIIKSKYTHESIRQLHCLLSGTLFLRIQSSVLIAKSHIAQAWHFLLLDNFAKLLQRPFHSRMIHSIEMHDLPCPYFHNHEDIQDSEVCHYCCLKIGSQNGFFADDTQDHTDPGTSKAVHSAMVAIDL